MSENVFEFILIISFEKEISIFFYKINECFHSNLEKRSPFSLSNIALFIFLVISFKMGNLILK
jgi:hypothetical protein